MLTHSSVVIPNVYRQISSLGSKFVFTEAIASLIIVVYKLIRSHIAFKKVIGDETVDWVILIGEVGSHISGNCAIDTIALSLDNLKHIVPIFDFAFSISQDINAPFVFIHFIGLDKSSVTNSFLIHIWEIERGKTFGRTCCGKVSVVVLVTKVNILLHFGSPASFLNQAADDLHVGCLFDQIGQEVVRRSDDGADNMHHAVGKINIFLHDLCVAIDCKLVVGKQRGQAAVVKVTQRKRFVVLGKIGRLISFVIPIVNDTTLGHEFCQFIGKGIDI